MSTTFRRLVAVTVVALAVAGVAAVARPAAPAAAHNDDHDHLLRPVVTTDADWAPVVVVLGRRPSDAASAPPRGRQRHWPASVAAGC